jgi:rhodanese-related sulfurtransferase
MAVPREFKAELFEHFARIGRALASGRRLELLELLAQRKRTVEDLARLAGMSVANTSQHLQVLRAARLVEVRKTGLHVTYRLADESVFTLWKALRELGERRLPDVHHLVRMYLAHRDSLEAVTIEGLKRRLRQGGTFVLDVRPAEEYAAGHIAGARSIPLPELEARLKELPKRQEIVAYCRGPYCVLADEAVALLRLHGRRAFRFEQGFPEWKSSGLPVERVEAPDGVKNCCDPRRRHRGHRRRQPAAKTVDSRTQGCPDRTERRACFRAFLSVAHDRRPHLRPDSPSAAVPRGPARRGETQPREDH